MLFRLCLKKDYFKIGAVVFTWFNNKQIYKQHLIFIIAELFILLCLFVVMITVILKFAFFFYLTNPSQLAFNQTDIRLFSHKKPPHIRLSRLSKNYLQQERGLYNCTYPTLFRLFSNVWFSTQRDLETETE